MLASFRIDPSFFAAATSRDLRSDSAAAAAEWIKALSDEQVAEIAKVDVAALASLDNDGFTDLFESLFDAGLDRTATLEDEGDLIDAAATARAEKATQL